MASQRPTSVLVIGILNILFGAGGLLCGMCATGLMLVGASASAQPAAKQGLNPLAQTQVQFTALREKLPSYTAVSAGQLAASTVLSTVLLVSGIGLVNMKPLGWAAGIVFSVGWVGISLFNLLYALIYVLPTQAEIAKTAVSFPGAPSADASQMIGYVSAAFGFLVPVAYAGTIVSILLRPHVKDAFERPAPPPKPFRRRRRDEDDD